MSETGPTSPKRLSLGLLMSFSSLVGQWAKRAGRAATKPKPNHHNGRRRNGAVFSPDDDGDLNSPRRLPPKSPFVTRPKQFISQISNKAIAVVHHRRRRKRSDEEEEEEEGGDVVEGLWQRGILMGDKCQPLDFSGVIYYDSNGKLLDEVPIRSPRATPLPAYLARSYDRN